MPGVLLSSLEWRVISVFLLMVSRECILAETEGMNLPLM